MIPFPGCVNTFVSGPVCSGKTYLLQQWLRSLTRVCVFDSTGELVSDSSFEHIWFSPAQFLRRLETNQYAFRVAYHPGCDVLNDCEWVTKILFQFDSVKTLAIDEFHLVCPNNAIGDEMEMLLRFARHAKVGLVGLSQRVADVHKLFTAGCRTIVLFYTEESCDIEAIGKRWGTDTAEMVSALRPLIYDDATGTVHQIPQCVVKLKGQRPRIFDFQTDKFTTGGSPVVTEETHEEEAAEEMDESGDGTTNETPRVPENPEEDAS